MLRGVAGDPHRRIVRALLAASLPFALLAPSCTDFDGSPEYDRASVSRVVDGDTIEVRLEGGSLRKVRLIGIDAPESAHPDDSLNSEAGEKASEFAESLLPPGTAVWLERDSSEADRYGRLLRYVWMEPPGPDGEPPEWSLANAAIVAAGHARPKSYPPDTARQGQIERAAERDASINRPPVPHA